MAEKLLTAWGSESGMNYADGLRESFSYVESTTATTIRKVEGSLRPLSVQIRGFREG